MQFTSRKPGTFKECRRQFRTNKKSISTCINTCTMQRKSCMKGGFFLLPVLGCFVFLCSYLKNTNPQRVWGTLCHAPSGIPPLPHGKELQSSCQRLPRMPRNTSSEVARGASAGTCSEPKRGTQEEDSGAHYRSHESLRKSLCPPPFSQEL